MGLVCARCADVKKNQSDSMPVHPDPDELEASEDESDDDHSEVAASDDEDDNQEEYRHGVEEILKTTGSSLKRGKTMAMKEAISTAKKCNIEASTITEAERRLDSHKRQQRREEAEKEVKAFYESPASRDRQVCERVLKRTVDAECASDVVVKLQEWLEHIILTRPLEQKEAERIREYLRQTCRDFVLQASQLGGRPVMHVDLMDGRRTPALLRLDAPLQNLSVREEDAERLDGKTVQVSTLQAMLAKDDKRVKDTKGFSCLEGDDVNCALSLRYELNRVPGVWCFVEQTPVKRDKLIEALSFLTALCG